VATTVDVAVVGAGLAGLATARLLKREGRSVVVLEARERVGGRIETHRFDDGAVAELGATWVGGRHRRTQALAAELGLPLVRDEAAGEPVVVDEQHEPRGGRLLARIEQRAATMLLERRARTVALDAPWASRGAAQLDERTLEAWLRRNVPREGARRGLAGLLEGVFAAEPSRVSLLYALFYLHAGGGLRELVASHGGAQEFRVPGGVDRLCTSLAEELHEDLLLGTTVTAVRHGGGGATVETEAESFAVRRVVVAVPPAVATAIRFDPELPQERAQLLAGLDHGDVTKIVAVYPSAFWRSRGLSGSAWGGGLDPSLVVDLSEPGEARGVLAAYYISRAARSLRALAPEERTRNALDALVRAFGPEAASPLHTAARDWTEERWTGGCWGAFPPPGVLSRHGEALRAPVGPVHWAGSETGREGCGYLEGALESAARAAAEVAATLAPERPGRG